MKNYFSFFTLKTFNPRILGENIYDTNKHLTPRFLEDNDPISAKSTACSGLPHIHFSSFEFFKHWFVYFLN